MNVRCIAPHTYYCAFRQLSFLLNAFSNIITITTQDGTNIDSKIAEYLDFSFYKSIDFSTLDFILLSHAIDCLALPVITERTPFSGRILAPFPIEIFGREFLETLCSTLCSADSTKKIEHYDSNSKSNSQSEFQEVSLENEILNVLTEIGFHDDPSHLFPDMKFIKRQTQHSSDFECLQRIPTISEITASCDKIQKVSFMERIPILYNVTIIPFAGGAGIGNCGWILTENTPEQTVLLDRYDLGFPNMISPSLQTKSLYNSLLYELERNIGFSAKTNTENALFSESSLFTFHISEQRKKILISSQRSHSVSPDPATVSSSSSSPDDIMNILSDSPELVRSADSNQISHEISIRSRPIMISSTDMNVRSLTCTLTNALSSFIRAVIPPFEVFSPPVQINTGRDVGPLPQIEKVVHNLHPEMASSSSSSSSMQQQNNLYSSSSNPRAKLKGAFINASSPPPNKPSAGSPLHSHFVVIPYTDPYFLECLMSQLQTEIFLSPVGHLFFTPHNSSIVFPPKPKPPQYLLPQSMCAASVVIIDPGLCAYFTHLETLPDFVSNELHSKFMVSSASTTTAGLASSSSNTNSSSTPNP